MKLQKPLGNLKNKLKDFSKKALVFSTAAVVLGTSFPKIYAGGTDTVGIFPPTKEIELETHKEKPQDFITTIYSEWTFHEHNLGEEPFMFNVMSGYNYLQNTMDEGILYVPLVRAQVKYDRYLDNYYNHRLDVGGGIAYQKAPIIVGIEGFHRESFREEGEDGDGLRVWGGYWDLWENKPLKIEETPDRWWLTNYAEFDYNTLEDNVAGSFRTCLNWDILNLKGVILGPSGAAKVSYDTAGREYNRYGDISGGVRIRKGALDLSFQVGKRKWFDGGEEDYNLATLSLWKRF